MVGLVTKSIVYRPRPAVPGLPPVKKKKFTGKRFVTIQFNCYDSSIRNGYEATEPAGREALRRPCGQAAACGSAAPATGSCLTV